MNAIVFGTPNLFVKGVAEQRMMDGNGNIVGFSKVLSEAAINTAVNLQEITGFNGSLVGMIPDSARITGTYTNQAFSLEERALATGGNLSYQGVHIVCETVTATDDTLAVTGTPVKSLNQPAADTLGWCYVKPVGSTTYMGSNFGINLETKKVANFAAVSGESYEVYYFVENASAKMLSIPSAINPVVVSVEVKYAVYAMQSNSAAQGTLYGYLYVYVPKAQLGGEGGGISGSQTANATGTNTWTALPTNDNDLSCDTCGQAGGNSAFYVLVPCGGSTAEVQTLVVVGNGVSVAVNGSAILPIKYLMPDNSVAQPNYADMTYQSKAAGTATVNANGVVTGVAAGSTVVTATLTKADGKTLTATVNVTVND